MNDKIGILLVEDDPVWRTMLTKFLDQEPDMRVLAAAASKEEAIAFCANNKADVVLMDIHLAGGNSDGIEATLELSLMGCAAKIIALTTLNNEDVVIDAFTAGALQFISKSDFRTIPDVIRSVVRSPDTPQEILVKEFRRLKEFELYSRLTEAEREIVSLYEKGYTRSHILNVLGKSESTVKNQVTAILRKFNARSMKEVIHLIRSRGLSRKESE